MKTILLKKQIILFVFMFFSFNVFAQMPSDPGDDPINTTEAGKQAVTVIAPDKGDEETVAILPAAALSTRKKLKERVVSKNTTKNSPAPPSSEKRKK